MQHKDRCDAFRAFRQAGERVAVQGIKRAFCLSGPQIKLNGAHTPDDGDRYAKSTHARKAE